MPVIHSAEPATLAQPVLRVPGLTEEVSRRRDWPGRRRHHQSGRQADPSQAAAFNGLYAVQGGTGFKTGWSLTASPACSMAPTCCGSKRRSPTWPRSPAMVDRHPREVMPNAKLVYNNSPSFNWTLNVPSAGVRRGMEKEPARTSPRIPTATGTDERRVRRHGAGDRSRQPDPVASRPTPSRDAGIFHHLITLPTYHTAALSTDNLARGYFGKDGMLAYVAGVQRQEIRQGIRTA